MKTFKAAFRKAKKCDLCYTWDIRPKKERRVFVSLRLTRLED